MIRVSKNSILTIKPYIPGKPIEEVKREFGLKDVIKLASNENPYEPSPKVLTAIAKHSRTLNRYPDGDCFYLRQALAKRLQVSPEQLIFGNGSDEIIVFAARVSLKKGDEVVIAKPSFLIYEIASKLEEAKIKMIPLKDFRYDLAAMKRAVTRKTKIIFLGNPDNPAGTYLSDTQIKDFLKGLRQDILIFIDEAYFEYVDAKDYGNSIELLKTYDNIIVTRTFSKLYGLAGLRVGYGIGNAKLIDVLNRVREPFNVNSLAQVAALACLNDEAYYHKIRLEAKAQKEYLYRELRDFGLSFAQSSTNFIMIHVNNAPAAAKRLMRKGIIVRDMSPWGIKNYIRVTIGLPQENRRFISALKDIL